MELHHQMPCWYYEKEELLRTPSFLDGVPNEVEDRYRSEGARFIFDMGTKLHLRYDTCATAIVFFHRFYMFHSFKAFPRYVTAACCLMLAGKVEETPKKCRDIIGTARALLPDHVMEQFGADPREEVMMYERILLKTIKFDLQVSHPYKYLLHFTKRIKGDPERIKQLLQMAWSFINDSLATTLCLQWEPEIVACAVLYLATRMKKCTIEDWEGRQPGQRWWECFVENMSTEVMEDICHKILDLYPASEGPGPRRTDQSDSGTRRELNVSRPDQQVTQQHSLKRPRPAGGRDLGIETSQPKSHAPASSNFSAHRVTDNRTEVSLGRDCNKPSQWTANSIAQSGSTNDLLPPPPPPPPLPDSRFPPHTQHPFHSEQQNSPGCLPPPPPPPPPPLPTGVPTLYPPASSLLQYNHPLPLPTHHQSAIPQSLPVRPAVASEPVILPTTFPAAFGPPVIAPIPPSTWFRGQPGLPVVQSAPALQTLASNKFAVGGQQQQIFDVVNSGGGFVRPML